MYMITQIGKVYGTGERSNLKHEFKPKETDSIETNFLYAFNYLS